MKKIGQLTNGVEVFETVEGNTYYKGSLEFRNVEVLKDFSRLTWFVKATDKKDAVAQLTCISGTIEGMEIEEDIKNGTWKLVIINDEEAESVLEKIKKADKNISLVVVNEDGKVFARPDTLNLYDVYSIPNAYGIYNEKNQVDSRISSDFEILIAIHDILKLGTLVDREQFSFNGYAFEGII